MIEFQNVTKRYSESGEALSDVTFRIERGELAFLTGHSGAGKSTLLRLIPAFERPSRGDIVLDGVHVPRLNNRQIPHLRRKLGLIFQDYRLLNDRSVFENVALPLHITGHHPQERRDRVNFCLKRVNLENANKKFPSELSGGMKKRVGIARAIALDTNYLFCDEPNSGLDPLTSRVIDNLLRDITHEFHITTIINSHDMKTVYDIGENIVFMHQVRVFWEGPKEEIPAARREKPELDRFIQASFIS